MTRIAVGPEPYRPAAEETNNRLTDAWWGICTMCWQRDPTLRPSMSDILVDKDSVGRFLLEKYAIPGIPGLLS